MDNALLFNKKYKDKAKDNSDWYNDSEHFKSENIEIEEESNLEQEQGREKRLDKAKLCVKSTLDQK